MILLGYATWQPLLIANSTHGSHAQYFPAWCTSPGSI